MRRAATFALALALGALNLVPVWLLLKQAVTPERESFAWPPTWWAHEPTLANFGAATRAVDLLGGLLLSVGVALAAVLGTLALAGPAAWVAARRPHLEKPLDLVLVLARMFPPLALAIPLAAIFVRVGLYNHPAGIGLVLAHVLLGLPFAFLVLRSGFAAVPRDLEEAALLDGASPAGAFFRVSLPLVRPSLGAASLLVFLLSWDEFAFSLLLQVTERPLPPLLYYLAAFGHPGLASAVAVILLVPALGVAVLIEPTLRSGGLAGSGR